MKTLEQIDYLRTQLGIRDSQVLEEIINSYTNAQASLQNQLIKQQQKIDKTIEEIDDEIFYLDELYSAEWFETKTENIINKYKKLKSILEDKDNVDKINGE